MVSDNRCMMCGKDNPPDLEECQYCQARLKPLIISNLPDESITRTDQAPPAPIEKQKSDAPDWLQDLGGSVHESEDNLTSDLEPAFDDVFKLPDADLTNNGQDWLADLRVDGGGLPDLSVEDDTSWDDEDKDFGDLIDEQVLEDRIPKSQTDQVFPSPVVEDDDLEIPSLEIEPSMDEDAPEWLQQIRSLHKLEQESSQVDDDSQSDESFDIEWDDNLDLARKDDLEEGLDRASVIFQDDVTSESSDEDVADSPLGLTDRLDNLDLVDVDELPDWLSSESKGSEIDESTSEIELPGVDESEFVTALSGDSVPYDEEDDLLTSDADHDAESEAPEWLAGLSSVADDIQEEAELVSSSEDVPDWLAALEKSSPEIPPISFKEEDDVGDLDLEWIEEDTLTENILAIDDASDVLDQPPQIDDAELFEGELTDLPDDDFVSQLGLDESVADDSDSVEHGELPIWMESMKPVEAVTPEIGSLQTAESQVEVSGPLAGLQGVLPAEPEFSNFVKPAVGSVKLNIIEKQHAQIAILDELIQSEGISAPIPDQPVVTSQSIFRVVIFSILVAIIAWTIFVGSQSQPLPAFPPEVFGVNSAVNNIPAGAPVLLAVDYDIGLSAEMEAASSVLLDHLMIRGAYLTVVSTTTTGPAQAEHLINTVNIRSEHQYSDPDQYTNLGFIPGGHSGLFAFAQAPRQVLPYSITGDHVWESEHLADIISLEQFALTAVITEDPDKARAWIEQVQPMLGDKPLIMALSAQADPMVRPYYDNQSNQLQGFVSGVAGGASYEALLNRLGIGRIYWDAFTRASIAGVVLIIVAGLVYKLVPKIELPNFLAQKDQG